MLNSRIDWCNATFNPVTGCLHGCEYCYARRIANRFKGHSDLDHFLHLEEHPEAADEKIHILDKPLASYNLEASTAPYPFGFEPTFYRYKLDEPQKWKKPRNIFVCSMADLFGQWVPDSWIEEVFAACEKAPQHNYLFLTKNPKRYIELAENGELPKRDNFWYGTSITHEDDPFTWFERGCGYHYFLSIEPLLEELGIFGNNGLNLPGWVIVGAETGRRKGKVIPKREWIENIVNQCRQYGIPVFMKSSLANIWGEELIQEFPKGLMFE